MLNSLGCAGAKSLHGNLNIRKGKIISFKDWILFIKRGQEFDFKFRRIKHLSSLPKIDWYKTRDYYIKNQSISFSDIL
jgi:hypothetical protein